ncbi:hypothetical protein HC864_05250 [Candidatus Gracilibacteria bacterium]|nr:hypothetical protein [Candidatus Gracilibacteria bacterium]
MLLNLDFNQKKDYKKSLLSLYEHREKPTLLFLGDLERYSLPLQEGMLRLLEEPPQNLHIILFSQTQSNILSTITSRSRVHTLPLEYIFQIIDPLMLQKVQNKLPPVKESVVSILKSPSSILIDNINKVEREEITFWLWQINEYLSQAYTKNPTKRLATKIHAVLQAINYNSQNLQKKFVLETLNQNFILSSY